MIKVIETNLSIDNENTIKDHQSRVIEVESWGGYIEEIMNEESIERKSVIGSLHGKTVPSYATVRNLIYDDFHLSYDIYNKFDIKGKKLAFKV